MKITYSITDNELLDIYKDQWENYFDHDFPDLSGEDVKWLKAEISRVTKQHINLSLVALMSGASLLVDLILEGGEPPYTLQSLVDEIEDNRRAERQSTREHIDSAMSLLEKHGYEVRKT